ncbi:MAG: GNAT family N-acetyltransferase [Dehalococcoidia bacterium]
MDYRIRSARRQDFPAIYDLLRVCFRHEPIETFIRQTEDDSTYRLRHTRVAEVDGRIVSHVRIFERRMRVRGVTLPAGGIGSVATYPEYEGRGLATALLRDTIERMEGARYALSFLFTGRLSFYERLGWRVVPQPIYTAQPEEVAGLSAAADVGVRPFTSADLSAVARVYRRATEGTTGAIVRSQRYWRDHMTWVQHDPEGFLLAEARGRVVAYVRSYVEVDNHLHLLEGEALPGAEDALSALLAELGRMAVGRGLTPMLGVIPEGHTLGRLLEGLPSTRVADRPPFPMMVRPMSKESEAIFSPGEPFHFWHSDLI